MSISIQEISTLDGKTIRCYVAKPSAAPKAAILVVQEIFGITDHIQWVLQEQYASAGYLAIAPAFFDRITGFGEFGEGKASNVMHYDEAGTAQGRAWVDTIGMDNPLRDLKAAQQQIAGALPCGVVGYCWGGSVAFLASTRLGLPSVSYYGGRTVAFLHERPQAPLMLHFGDLDPLITQEAVTKTRTTLINSAPAASVYQYPAGHGFNRFGHKDFHEASATLALERSLNFFNQSFVKQINN